MGSVYESSPTVTGTTDYPELCVEWLPTLGPGAADGPWADITRFVASGKTARGRQYEIDRFQAGTATLELVVDENEFPGLGRLFDPEWTTGPWFPYLVPMRQVRISATWAGVYYPVWRGYITDWGQVAVQDTLFRTTITAKDAFVVLEQIKLPSSAWAMEIVKDDPSLWLRLGETDTVRVTDSSDGGNFGLYDNCEQGAEGLVVNDADGAVAFAHSLEERVLIQNPDLITAYPFTLSMMFKVDNSDPSGLKTMFTTGRGFFRIAMAYSFFAGGIHVHIGFAGNTRAVLTVQNFDDDLPHHLAVVIESSSSFLVYVDGVLQSTVTATTGAGTPAWSTPRDPATIGNYPDLSAASGDFGFGTNDLLAATAANPYPLKKRGTLDEVCVWNGVAVDADRIAAHAAAALDGWDADDTGTRVSRFLDVLEWPDELRDIDPGISTLGPSRWSAGSTALAAMQGWADTELGAFFADGAGKIVWRSRHYPILDSHATTSQATFNDDSSADLSYQELELQRDETLLRNPVSASRRGGVSVTVKDDPGIEKYGDRSWASPGTEDRLDSAVRDRAIWLLARFKELGSRLKSLVFMPRSDPTTGWPAVLGLELGYRITVNRTPLGQGNLIATDQIIERVEHQFAPKQWTTRFAGSPVDANIGNYLILDDANDGLLDTGLLGY